MIFCVGVKRTLTLVGGERGGLLRGADLRGRPKSKPKDTTNTAAPVTAAVVHSIFRFCSKWFFIQRKKKKEMTEIKAFHSRLKLFHIFLASFAMEASGGKEAFELHQTLSVDEADSGCVLAVAASDDLLFASTQRGHISVRKNFPYYLFILPKTLKYIQK